MNVYQQYAPEAISDFDINENGEILSDEMFFPFTIQGPEAEFLINGYDTKVIARDGWLYALRATGDWKDTGYGRGISAEEMQYVGKGDTEEASESYRAAMSVKAMLPHPPALVAIRSHVMTHSVALHRPIGDGTIFLSFTPSHTDNGDPVFIMAIDIVEETDGGCGTDELLRRSWRFSMPAGWEELNV